MNGTHISKVVKFQLRVSNVQVTHHQAALMKELKKSIKSDCVQQIMFLTFWAYHTLSANIF
jgi:hypothetical protein